MILFLKLSILFAVSVFRFGPIRALDASPVYHYYKTTRFTMYNEWPYKQTAPPEIHIEPSTRSTAELFDPVTAPPLPQPATYYISPMSVSILKPQLAQTSATSAAQQSAIAESVYATKLANNLPSEIAETGLSNVPPLNPAPMLQPNPFINKQGLQIQFATKSSNVGSKNEPQRREEGSFCRRSFDGRSGYCILAYQCLHVIREYRLHGTKIDICTYRKNIPVICCPLADKHIDDQRISAQKCQDHHEAVKHIKLEIPRTLSGKMCVSSVPLIVGGEPTHKDEYPHMAALGWTQSDKDLKWGCGGTLISDLFVLTAAHCATSGGKPPDMVRLGAENLNRTSKQQQDIKILIIILHPKYRSSSYYHDIALLKLTKRAHFSAAVRPACLWQLPEIEMPSAIATGWGRTEFMGPKSDKLQRVDLNIIDQKTCKDIYSKERRLPRGIIEGQFCAGHLEGGKDTCQGDSGGPLHAQLPEYNCVKFVIGITSFGKFCAAPNAPGVYTRIYSYLDWIEKIVFRG